MVYHFNMIEIIHESNQQNMAQSPKLDIPEISISSDLILSIMSHYRTLDRATW